MDQWPEKFGLLSLEQFHPFRLYGQSSTWFCILLGNCELAIFYFAGLFLVFWLIKPLAPPQIAHVTWFYWCWLSFLKSASLPKLPREAHSLMVQNSDSIQKSNLCTLKIKRSNKHMRFVKLPWGNSHNALLVDLRVRLGSSGFCVIPCLCVHLFVCICG